MAPDPGVAVTLRFGQVAGWSPSAIAVLTAAFRRPAASALCDVGKAQACAVRHRASPESAYNPAQFGRPAQIPVLPEANVWVGGVR